MLAVELFLLWLAVLAVRRHHWIPADVFLLNAVSTRVLWATLLAAVGGALLVGEIDQGIAAVLDSLAWSPPLEFRRFQLSVQLITDLPSALTVLLALVLIPALCEEAFFRGFVYTGLCYHHGPTTAIGGSALLFAAAHFNPWQFPSLFLLGLFLAALVYWTHSIYPALLAHAANNALSVAAVNLRTQTGWDVLGAGEPLPIIVVVGAVVALLIGVRRLRRERPIMPILSPFARPAPAAGPHGVGH